MTDAHADLRHRIRALEDELGALRRELDDDAHVTSRRELLRTAAATAVGAVGSAAVLARPAAAATGGNLILGQDNTAEAMTGLQPRRAVPRHRRARPHRPEAGEPGRPHPVRRLAR